MEPISSALPCPSISFIFRLLLPVSSPLNLSYLLPSSPPTNTQLMYESDIRLLDLRHTLPNLKNILLHLSSPDPPPPGPVTGPGWASGAGSRASSRQASATFNFAHLNMSRHSSLNLSSSANLRHLRSGSLASNASNVSLGSFGPPLQGEGEGEASVEGASAVSVGPTESSEGGEKDGEAQEAGEAGEEREERHVEEGSDGESDATEVEGYVVRPPPGKAQEQGVAARSRRKV